MARKLKPRLTKTDPDFSDAVVRALVKYRDSRRLKDAQIADLLGVSKPTLSKYLSQAIQIGGAVLARAFVELNIEVNYQGKVISATDFQPPMQVPVSAPQQMVFEFNQPYLLKETNAGLVVMIERKSPISETVVATIKLAG
jgi:transcriptional regulator with XRE-family HTH domain